MDLPAMVQHDPIDACVQQAAAHYRAHPDIVRAVLRTENGKPGTVRWNKNGSFDMGPMQVNSVHLAELGKYGITQEKLTNDTCLNIHVGTYYLQKGILKATGRADTPLEFWRGVGNYRSETPGLNGNYQVRVWSNLVQLRNGRGSQ
jgi:hypothetical protein